MNSCRSERATSQLYFVLFNFLIDVLPVPWLLGHIAIWCLPWVRYWVLLSPPNPLVLLSQSGNASRIKHDFYVEYLLRKASRYVHLELIACMNATENATWNLCQDIISQSSLSVQNGHRPSLDVALLLPGKLSLFSYLIMHHTNYY